MGANQFVFNANFGRSAYYFDGTTVHSLGTLGGPTASALAFNVSGQVVGVSASSMGGHAFVWTLAGGMIELGLPGEIGSFATGINAYGQVIGYSLLPGGNLTYHAFSWTQAGGIVDLGTLGGSRSRAFAVNDSGQVVGYAMTAGDLELHPFLWAESSGMIDLGVFGENASASLINNAGQIAGVVQDSTGLHSQGFFWSPSTGKISLGTFGGNNSSPYVMNDAGQVAGLSSFVNDIGIHAFYWTPSTGLLDIGLGGTVSHTEAISPSGQVVGYSYLAGDTIYHPFSFTERGGVVDLGSLGGRSADAWSVNASGQVVGFSDQPGNLPSHGFLWTANQGMRDLNALIASPPAGFEVFSAQAISDAGYIVADSSAGLVLLGPATASPVLGPITANDPAAVGASVSFAGDFTDAGVADTHTATWSWGDGSPDSPGNVAESSGAGTVSGTHTYRSPGLYNVALNVTDSTGKTTSVAREVVIFDPAGGYVTGRGWINSPAGAYPEDPALTGRATFAFVSKYENGKKAPSGRTDFQFRAAKLAFYSNNYDWMLISGSRVRYSGHGSINGSGNYSFELTAIDGKLNGKSKGKSVDRFRIRIWSESGNGSPQTVIYDNQIDPSAIGTSDEGTVVGGGGITIQK